MDLKLSSVSHYYGDTQVLRDITLDIPSGQIVCIVGPSGCGKSTLARLLMRLLDPTEGQVTFDGQDISHVTGADLTRLRRDMQFIFQDPFSSLNPRMTVGKLIGEPLEVHAPDLSARDRRQKVAELLQQVGAGAGDQPAGRSQPRSRPDTGGDRP